MSACDEAKELSRCLEHDAKKLAEMVQVLCDQLEEAHAETVRASEASGGLHTRIADLEKQLAAPPECVVKLLEATKFRSDETGMLGAAVVNVVGLLGDVRLSHLCPQRGRGRVVGFERLPILSRDW